MEDFIDQEVTLLFIIELEDIGNFSKNSRLRISSWAMEKKKASPLELQRLIAIIEEIEVYESSRHEERKKRSFQDIDKNEHFFLCILPLQVMPTMRQKKKKSIFKFSHSQNKKTEINLRIEKTISKYSRKIFMASSTIEVSTTKNIFDVPSKKNWIIDF